MLILHCSRLSLSVFVLGLGSLNLLAEQNTKYLTYKRLNEKQLTEKRKGEVVAHELQPIGKKRENRESLIVGVVEPCGNKAHDGTHNSHGSADDSRFKNNGMRCADIEHLACEAGLPKKTSRQ